MKRLAFYLIAVAVVVLDRVTKLWALQALADGRSVPVIPGYLSFSLVLNRGSAFGIVPNGSLVLAALAVIAVGVMLWVERKGLPGRLVTAAVALELGGALGNLADRLRLGHVVDFIELDWHGRNIWPVFNMADSAITIGAVLLCWWLWRGQEKEVVSSQ